jgi:hypothetical protein
VFSQCFLQDILLDSFFFFFLLFVYLFIYVSTPLFYVLPMMGSHLDSNSLANFHALIFVFSDKKKNSVTVKIQEGAYCLLTCD